MKKFNDRLEKVLLAAIVLLLTTMTLVVVLGIVARYILLVSIPWTEEMSRYFMIWTAFMAFGLAYRRRELILVRMLIDRLPLKVYRYTMAISDLLCGFFLLLVVIYGVKLCLLNTTQVSPAARIPMSIIYSAIPVGCGLCLLFIVESMIDFFKKYKGADQSW
jgi:TRAP-type C4-dicarboxylate transport system permease small subunit